MTAAAAINLANERRLLFHYAPLFSWVTFILPVLVINGLLFAYSLTDGGDESLDHVDDVLVTMASPADGSLSGAQVMSYTSFAHYLDTLTPAIDTFAKAMLPYCPEVLSFMAGLRGHGANPPSSTAA